MSKYAIAIIVSEFNTEITEELLAGALKTLKEAQGVQISVYRVPGAIEIPFISKMLSETKRYKAIIALGCVIRGETDHYDYVCQQVSFGCQQVMLETMTPVIFGVLTTENLQQALDRVSYDKEHKGDEAAKAALQMIKLLDRISKE